MRRSEFPEGGKFDNDNFYIMPGGGYFDPFGFWFDKDGLDEAGGKYDEEGYYVSPFGDDDFFAQDNDFDEEQDEDSGEEGEHDALERQAII